jgi:hypothetical protein
MCCKERRATFWRACTMLWRIFWHNCWQGFVKSCQTFQLVILESLSIVSSNYGSTFGLPRWMSRCINFRPVSWKKTEPVVPAYRKINSTLGQCLWCFVMLSLCAIQKHIRSHCACYRCSKHLKGRTANKDILRHKKFAKKILLFHVNFAKKHFHISAGKKHMKKDAPWIMLGDWNNWRWRSLI